MPKFGKETSDDSQITSNDKPLSRELGKSYELRIGSSRAASPPLCPQTTSLASLVLLAETDVMQCETLEWVRA